MSTTTQNTCKNWLTSATTLAIACTITCLTGMTAKAQLIDNTFGVAGTAKVDLAKYDPFTTMTVAPDGSIFLLSKVHPGGTANIAISKLTPDGVLDPTFGGFGPLTPGTMVHDIWGDDWSFDLKVLDDGKLLVLCTSQMHASVLLRLETDGLLDVTFGNLGVCQVDAPFGEIGGPTAIAHPVNIHLHNDKILVVHHNGVVRLNEDGARDMPYGTNGMVRFDTAVGTEMTAVKSDMDGARLVIFGEAWEPHEDGLATMRPRLLALNEDGDNDPAFGVNGQIQEPVSHLTKVSALEAHNGILTIAGGDILMQIDSTGMLRGNFSINGVTDVFEDGEVTDIELMTYGRIAVSVKMPPIMGNAFSVARFLPDGTLDPTFAHSTFGPPVDGWMSATYGHAAFAKKLFAYANGKLLVGGEFRFNVQGEAGQDMIVMRLNATSEGTPEGNPDGVGGIGGIKAQQRTTHSPINPNTGKNVAGKVSR